MFQFINGLFQHLTLTEHAPEYVLYESQKSFPWTSYPSCIRILDACQENTEVPDCTEMTQRGPVLRTKGRFLVGSQGVGLAAGELPGLDTAFLSPKLAPAIHLARSKIITI